MMSPIDGPGSMVCPSCGRLIGRDVRACPYCQHSLPGLGGLKSPLDRLFGGGVSFTQVFFTICIGMYVIVVAASAMAETLGEFLTPDFRVLYKAGMMTPQAIYERGHIWRLIMPIFLHGSLIHIFFNMMWLRRLGPVVEELFGSARFCVIFLLTGIVGFIVSSMTPGASVGASGSICGLIGALGAYGHKRGGEFGERIKKEMMVCGAMLVVLGFLMPRIDNAAHAGGAAAGVVLGLLFSKRAHGSEKESPRLRLGAACLLIGAAVSFAITVVQGLGGETLQKHEVEEGRLGQKAVYLRALANAISSIDRVRSQSLDDADPAVRREWRHVMDQASICANHWNKPPALNTTVDLIRLGEDLGALASAFDVRPDEGEFLELSSRVRSDLETLYLAIQDV